MTSYDEWKLATPPYWEEPEEWESAKCKECEYFQKLTKGTELCLSEPILNDEPRADLVHGDSQACEVFKRRIGNTHIGEDELEYADAMYDRYVDEMIERNQT